MARQGLASIGIDVKINEVAMNYVTDIGDIGGTPSDLDATCIKDKMKKMVPGVKDVSAWEVTYLYDNSAEDSDFRKLKALETANIIVPVAVEFPDGTKFESTGYINTMVNGAQVDELISAKVTVSLQSDWVVTDPTTT